MDKYEYKLKTEQMLELMNAGAYKQAAEIADTIDWKRVRNTTMLGQVGEIYEKNRDYQKGYDVLRIAYNHAEGSRKIAAHLCDLALKTKRIDKAIDYYDDFVEMAPRDPNQYILRYQILRAQRAPIEQQIHALEEYKKREYTEEWAYELAKCYQAAGMTDKCLEECDDLILWFSEGKYVYQAMELKMQYKPLTPSQQQKYDRRNEKAATETEELPDLTQYHKKEASPEQDQQAEAAVEEQITETEEKLQESKRRKIGNTMKLDEALKALLNISIGGDKAEEEEADGGEQEEDLSGLEGEIEEIESVADLGFADHIAEIRRKARATVDTDLEELKPEPETVEAETAAVEGGPETEIVEVEPEAEIVEVEAAKVEVEPESKAAGEDEQIEGQMTLSDLAGGPETAEAEGVTEEQFGPSDEDVFEEFDLEDAEEFEALDLEDAEEFDAEGFEVYAENEEIEGEKIKLEEGNAMEEKKNDTPILSPDIQRLIDEIEGNLSAEEVVTDETELEEMDDYETILEEIDDEEEEEDEDDLFSWSDEDAVDAEEAEGIAAVLYDTDDAEAYEEYDEAGYDAEEAETYDEYDEDDYEAYDEDDYEDAGDAEAYEEDDYDVEEDAYEEDDYDAAEAYEEDYEDDAEAYEEDDYDVEEDAYEEDDYDADDAEPYEEAYEDDYEDTAESVAESIEEEFAPQKDDREYDDREIPDDDDGVNLLSATTPLSRKETAKLIATGKTAPLPLDEITNALSMTDTGFIVHARYDLNTQGEGGRRATLTEEQKKLFSYFVPVRGMSEQLVDVLEQDKNCTNRRGTSATGNLLIIGNKGNGKTVLAVDVVKAIQKQRKIRQGKVAIVTGDSLNKKKISEIVRKLYGGALIIEKAGKMNERTVARLNKAMEHDTGEMLIVLEDQRKPLDRLLSSNREFRRKFTSRLEVPVFINDELVTFGQTYAQENGYRIDEMSILALYSRIDALQREDHAVTIAEVKEIMDEAMAHSQKASAKKLVKRVFGKNTDDSDRIILTEKDFNI